MRIKQKAADNTEYAGSSKLSVSRFPFYYGWIILAVGTLGIIASIPGQTMGVSAFTDYLIEALQVTRVNISTAYMIGTFASALLIPYAGKLYDRFGARKTAAASSLFLGIFLLLLSVSGTVSAFLDQLIPVRTQYIGFAAAVTAFFGIRFFGQGVLTLVSRGMVVKWFTSRRGLAVAVIGVATSFGFSYAPQPIHRLIGAYGWNGALTVLAASLILIFLPIVLAAFRDSPQSCGMEAEEGLSVKKENRKRIPDAEQSKTASQARKDLRYWIIVLLLGLWALFNTALTFHVVSIFQQTGTAASDALRIFFPIGVLSFLIKGFASWLSDRIHLKVYIILLAASVMLSGAALFMLASPFAEVLLIMGMGTAGGVFSMLNFITWPRLYGTEHLGDVSGFAMGFVVGGSAVGPWLFSIIYQAAGGYSLAGLICAAAAGILGAGALWFTFTSEADQERLTEPESEKRASIATG